MDRERERESSGPFFPELDEFHSCEDLPRTLHRGESEERERQRESLGRDEDGGNREERTERIEEEAENRSNLVERAITRMARQTSPRPLLGRVLFSLRQIE